MNGGLSKKDVFELYEQGKHRRYGLLFSVNGGAFAIGRLLVGDPDNGEIVLGGLTIQLLAGAMIFFSLVMCVDIYQFGLKMKGLDKMLGSPDSQLFGVPGQVVLALLAIFLMAAWAIVGFLPVQTDTTA
jgi:hypothetical protein